MINWKQNIAPSPPYYASIFHYLLGDDLEGYAEMDALTLELALQSDGFLGYESHNSPGRGSFISYWRDLDAIDTWRKNATHITAKKEGRKRWYKYYHAMIAKVESAHFHSFEQ
ncbi:MAG: antibiotic biosynthesis monooxygenase [Cryomorphaceae bacterium]